MGAAVRQYAVVTAAYWAFTLTDGALRMLVLLHFAALGYEPVQLAFMFLLYEACGVVTNVLGGWLASRVGLRATLVSGLGLQVAALGLLALLEPDWARATQVAYVMGAQALSGVAKDLTKTSAKSSLKGLVSRGGGDDASTLFRWVAWLTGSKNALKGVGFFLGGALLAMVGFAGALGAMAGTLGAATLAVALAALPRDLGRSPKPTTFTASLVHGRAINVLALARLFLFAARDVWFVVAVPVFLASSLGWSSTGVGSFLALWVIGYGGVQALAPRLFRGHVPDGRAALALALALAAATAAMPVGLALGASAELVVLGGLVAFGAIFAVSSSVHSYLVLAYADGDRVATQVGFYYTANALGRLVGALLSGVLTQAGGLPACLWAAAALAGAAALTSAWLPRHTATAR